MQNVDLKKKNDIVKSRAVWGWLCGGVRSRGKGEGEGNECKCN
jgi:hypothetical protein